MKLHLLPFLIFLLLLVGCTTSNEQIKMVWKERNIPEMTPLQESDSLVIPQTFNLLTWSINGNSIYFVSSGMQDNFLSVYRYPECVKRFDFGRIGQGADEFITLNAGEARNNRLLLFDIMGRKALLLDTEDDTLCIADRLELYNDEEGLCRPFTYITQMDTDNYVMKIDDATSSAWEIADVSGIIIFFNVLSGTGNRYAVQQLKEVKVQCFQQSVRGAMISGELAPRIEGGLRLTEDFVNALGGVKLFVDLCSVSLIGKGKLVFQVDKFVVDRRCGEHQHFCPNSGTDHSVEQF